MVFYGYAPAMGFWLMKLYGHVDVRILDCTRSTWRDEGYPWATAQRHPGSPPTGLGRREHRSRASAPRSAAHSGGPKRRSSMSVVERSIAESPFGHQEVSNQAAGQDTFHTPSTFHWMVYLMIADRIGPKPSWLKCSARILELPVGHEVITYCTIGGRAATAWFVLTHLLRRRKVRVYDGSWAEWGRIRRRR